MSLQCLAFRMLSKMGSMVYQLLAVPTTLCPMRLFKVLEDPEEADQVQALPQCMVDEFSAAFMKKYPKERLQQAEARHCLHLLSLSMPTQILSPLSGAMAECHDW